MVVHWTKSFLAPLPSHFRFLIAVAEKKEGKIWNGGRAGRANPPAAVQTDDDDDHLHKTNSNFSHTYVWQRRIFCVCGLHLWPAAKRHKKAIRYMGVNVRTEGQQ